MKKNQKKKNVEVVTKKEKDSSFTVIIIVTLIFFVVGSLIFIDIAKKTKTAKPENTKTSYELEGSAETIEPQLLKMMEQTPATKKFLEGELQKRQGYLKKWIAGAEKIVELTSDQQAKELLEFVKKNSNLYLPNERIFMVLLDETRFKVGNFGILFVDSEDLKRYPEWSNMINAGAVGYYHPYFRAIIIPVNSERSDITMGIILLHETQHAKDAFGQPPKKVLSQAEVTPTEIPVHEFQNKIIRKIGGKEYVKYVNEYAEKMKKDNMRHCFFDEFTQFNPPVPSDPDLFQKIYGYGQKNEMPFALTNLTIDACFTLLDNLYKDEANEHKIAFMNSLYTHNQ